MPPKGIFKGGEEGGRGLATTPGTLLGQALREEGGDVIIGSKKYSFFRGQGRGDRILFWVLFFGGVYQTLEAGGGTIKPLRRLVGEKKSGVK